MSTPLPTAHTPKIPGWDKVDTSCPDDPTQAATPAQSGHTPCKGYIGTSGCLIYFTNGHDVFRVPAASPGVPDIIGGYLQGRWECTVTHWNRFCEAVYSLPPIKL